MRLGKRGKKFINVDRDKALKQGVALNDVYALAFCYHGAEL
jgi:hypothetical protein